MSDECKTREPDRLVSSSVALVMTVDSLERHFSEAMRQRVCSPGPTDPGEHRRIFMQGDRDDRRLRLLRSEEHTSELQSRLHLVCRLLLEKKNRINNTD